MRPTLDPEGIRILVVDDDDYIRDLVSVALRFVGFEVDSAHDGRDALGKIAAGRPDLVVLDVTMPHFDGMEVVRRMRHDGNVTPVVFLTARDAADEKVKGLHAGGDDYVTKPFSLDELLARIEAVLRRVSRTDRWRRRITIADLTLDQDARDVVRDGQRVELSRTEFNVLEFLMSNAGRVVSKQQILEHVWQYDFGGESTVVETYISYLRRKVDALGAPMIHTVRGVGYVLRVPGE